MTYIGTEQREEKAEAASCHQNASHAPALSTVPVKMPCPSPHSSLCLSLSFPCPKHRDNEREREKEKRRTYKNGDTGSKMGRKFVGRQKSQRRAGATERQTAC